MKYSHEAKEMIGAKMHKMKMEKKKRPRAQMIAIALAEARKKGMKVPEKD